LAKKSSGSNAADEQVKCMEALERENAQLKAKRIPIHELVTNDLCNFI
jgi:hypothetical protein